MKRRMFHPVPMALLSAALLRLFPAGASLCRACVSRPLTGLLSRLSAALPHPAAAPFILILTTATAALSVRAFASRRAARWLAALLSALLFAYLLLWDVLYACPAATAGKLAPQALYRLCEQLIEKAEDALPFAESEENVADLCEAGCELMRAHTGLPLMPAKAARFPGLLSALGLAGVYAPLTAEAIVNPDDLPDTLPFTICHELAHQAGFAREGEANYCALLACEESGNALFIYSACFSTLLYAMKALRAVDQAGWQRALSCMSASLYARFVRANGLNASHPRGAHAFQQALTDAFLRVSGDPDGIASYERVLPLAAAHWGLTSGEAGQTGVDLL